MRNRKCLPGLISGTRARVRGYFIATVLLGALPTVRGNTVPAALLQQTKITVTGKVTDEKGVALPGTTVQIKGMQTAVVTDDAGAFSVNLENANATLVFSAVGYTSHEEPVKGRTDLGTIVLQPSKAASLDEVVVIGYGTAKKSDLTGAVATLKSDKLMDAPVPNVTQALQGKVAGVEVSVNNNAPGAGAKVRIRGLGSINSSLDPLYVVDGVVGVDANTLNPNDIASMEVLKDASSTAIYGARGANGVVMITTKRGRRGGTQVSYEGNVNVAQLSRHIRSLNATEFMKVYNDAMANADKFNPQPVTSPYTPPPALNHANYPDLFDANDQPLYNTNWESEIYKPAVSTSHQLNFQGGNEKTTFGLSLGYLDQNGIMAESWFKRYSARFTLDNEVNKWLKVGGSIGVVKGLQRMVSDGNGGLNVPRMVAEALPILPIKYPNGKWAGNSDIAGMEGGPNPVHIANNRYSLNNTIQALGNTYLLFRIAKGLEFKSDFGYNLNNLKNNFYSAMDLHNLSMDAGGEANLNTYQNVYWQSENYLTWNRDFSNGHRMTAMLGASWQEYNQERLRADNQQFIDDIFQWHYLQAGAVRNASESEDYRWAMNSYYARVTYNIQNKYLFTVTGRYDGSSKFGKNNKYAFFPSLGVAWRASEEDFLKNSTVVSDLKIRASYGAAGNQEIDPYTSLQKIQPGSTILGENQSTTLVPTNMGNPDLKWEVSWQGDVGVELGLWNNRVYLTADAYSRTTKDLLLQTPIPWSAGFDQAYVYRNIGSVRNTGLEISLNTVNIDHPDFKWSTNFIFATNRNRILQLNDGNADIFPGPNFLGQTNILRVGEAIGTFWGRTRLGTYSEDEAALAATQNLKPGDRKYLLNEDGSEHYGVIGRANPKWTGTFSSTINYKNFDFSFDIRFVQGMNTAATFKHSTEDRQTIANSLATVLNAWTPDNQNTMISQVRPYKFAQDSKFDTWWVEDGSFIRGQNFILGYSIPKTTVDRWNIQKLRIYASVQNLFLSTKYTGYDPEVDTYNTRVGSNGTFSQNLDFFSYPRPRVWNLGVSLVF